MTIQDQNVKDVMITNKTLPKFEGIMAKILTSTGKHLQ